MKNARLSIALALAACAPLSFAQDPITGDVSDLIGQDESPQSIGPDVIVGDLNGVTRWGSDSANTMNIYSVGTTSCNIGTMRLDWISSNNRHPVIGQNMFRYKVTDGVGRFEQIGQSWLKHGFTALSGTVCNNCPDPTDGSQLGVGCSDPYGASLNGEQTRLGPRNHVNAATGFYPYPFTNPGPNYPTPPAPAPVIGRRLQVMNADLNPALNSGARYFVEGQYVTWDEPAWGTNHNNCAYRPVNVSGSGTNFTVTNTGTTVRERAAIYAWKDVCDSSVVIQEQIVRNDGMLILGSRVTDLANGRFAYEYAIFNNTSDRSAGSFSVPVCEGAVISDVGFHDVNYHSGEPYDNTDWVADVGSGSVTWRTTQTYAQNPNANALRWGTMYNFRFVADRGPGATQRTASIGLFKPGSPSQVLFGVPAPSNCCPSDFDSNGHVDFFDYLDFVQAFSNNDPRTDYNNDDVIDFFDYLAYVSDFDAGC
jgi:hypothetical protein